jgi:membrane-bound lytic murein transglycosylase A
MYSLEYLSKPSSEQYFPYLDISHARAVSSVEAFIDVVHTAQSGAEFDAMIKDRFDIYMSRGYDEQGTVLFTGYYRPIFDARTEPDSEFRYPLYKRPADLVLNEGTMTYGRAGGGEYLTRSDIEHGALEGKGLELVWLRDRFEAYIVTVQGSARLRMRDGSYFDIGYHGDNGHEYGSVGQWLVTQGQIQPNKLSLQGLIAYFQQNPQMLDEALAVNDRYVFFTPREGGPYGALNVPVTPFRSIATDNDVYPRAGVAFLQTQVPGRSGDGSIQQYQFEGFAMDQDTGGAIRAAGRCDIFMGTGPEVGELAGRTFAEGRLYYIFLKEQGATYDATMAGPGPSYEPEVPEPTHDDAEIR